MGVCCCLQIRNPVVNMVVMGLVLGQSLMVISTLLLCKSMYCEVCCCLHVNCLQTCEHIVHIGPSKFTRLCGSLLGV